MKKIILFSLGLMVAFSMNSCKKSKINETNSLNKDIFDDNEQSEIVGTSSKETIKTKVDFDWSKMNYNMLSSLIFDVQINPEKYAGKRVKSSGNFFSSVYEGRRYFSVLVWDITGCCPAGLDFVPPADMKYPEDFPEPDEKITVTGVFKYSRDNEQEQFIFQAEEIVRE